MLVPRWSKVRCLDGKAVRWILSPGCPNDSNDAKTPLKVEGTEINEAFVGSSMSNIGRFRAAEFLTPPLLVPYRCSFG